MCEEIPTSFVGVIQRKNGKATVLNVPGSNGTQYRVILRRKGKAISAECAQDIGALGYKHCQGNHCTKTLCRHSRVAIRFALKEAGFNGALCKSLNDARRLHNAKGGTIYPVHSWDGNGVAYFLINKETK